MEHITKEQLDCIASVLSEKDRNLYTKTSVNRAIVSALSKRVGWSCSFGYIANLRNGVQLDKTSTMLKAKIDQLYTILCSPKKPARVIPDNEIAKRTLVIHATKPELHKIQGKFTTRERTEVLLHSV